MRCLQPFKFWGMKFVMANQYLPPVITIPSSLSIIDITQSVQMVVTIEISNDSTEANTYIPGMAVRLFVPKTYGMFQANNLVGTIVSIDGAEFTLNINSSQFDSFSIPSGNTEQPASISPAGSRNYEYTNGSSLSVPFQSLNNLGN